MFNFLPDLRDIAICACISRLWRQAADQAVPMCVVMVDDQDELSRLFAKPKLNDVNQIDMSNWLSSEPSPASVGGLESIFMAGALFMRICAEAAGKLEICT